MKILGIQQAYRRSDVAHSFIVEITQSEMELLAGKSRMDPVHQPVDVNLVDTVRNAREFLERATNALKIAGQLRSLADIVEGSTQTLHDMVKLPEPVAEDA